MQNIKNGSIYLMIGLLTESDHVVLVDDPESTFYKLLREMKPDTIFLRLSKKGTKFKGVESFQQICKNYIDAVKSLKNDDIPDSSNLPIVEPERDENGDVVNVHASNKLYMDIYLRVTNNDWKRVPKKSDQERQLEIRKISLRAVKLDSTINKQQLATELSETTDDFLSLLISKNDNDFMDTLNEWMTDELEDLVYKKKGPLKMNMNAFNEFYKGKWVVWQMGSSRKEGHDLLTSYFKNHEWTRDDIVSNIKAIDTFIPNKKIYITLQKGQDKERIDRVMALAYIVISHFRPDVSLLDAVNSYIEVLDTWNKITH